MAVIAGTKDIWLNLQQNRFNLDMRRELPMVKRIKPFTVLGSCEVSVSRGLPQEIRLTCVRTGFGEGDGRMTLQCLLYPGTYVYPIKRS